MRFRFSKAISGTRNHFFYAIIYVESKVTIPRPLDILNTPNLHTILGNNINNNKELYKY